MKHIYEIIERELDEEITSLKRCSGGSINEVVECRTNNHHLVLKINDAEQFPKMFEKEVKGLHLLRSSSFRIPKVLKQGLYQNWSFLILEFIDCKGANINVNLLGHKLAEMHTMTAKNFGLEHNNYIGSISQKNNPKKNWCSFYQERRLEPLVKTSFNQGWLDRLDLLLFEKLYLELENLIPKEVPALLHGDLWQGNIICDKDSMPVLIDPAVYYGHREMDLAMLLMFGSISAQTMDAYNSIYPIEKNWKSRTDIHQLYPLLVHLVLFGGSYLGDVKKTVRKYS